MDEYGKNMVAALFLIMGVNCLLISPEIKRGWKRALIAGFGGFCLYWSVVLG